MLLIVLIELSVEEAGTGCTQKQ